MKAKFSQDLMTALAAAREGASVIRTNTGIHPEISVKADSQTLVTNTDVAAETAIMDVLQKNSSYGILSEESGPTGSQSGPVWVVDPLDGTSNFARSLPFYAVSVALVHEHDLLVGVVIDPERNTEYTAIKGGGALYNGIPVVAPPQIYSVPCLFLNHGSSAGDKLLYAQITQLLSKDYNLRKPGATALELCYVATGLFDGFICAGDELWDYAAGALIAEEAGCAFSDWQGRKWRGDNNSILVCRPSLHEGLIKALCTL